MSLCRWQAQIKINYKTIHVGSYPDERAAADAYDKKARALGRPTNFNPDGTPETAWKVRALRDSLFIRREALTQPLTRSITPLLGPT